MKNYNFAEDFNFCSCSFLFFLTNVLIILFKGIIGKCEPNLLKICQPLHFIVSVISSHWNASYYAPSVQGRVFFI